MWPIYLKDRSEDYFCSSRWFSDIDGDKLDGGRNKGHRTGSIQAVKAAACLVFKIFYTSVQMQYEQDRMR